MTLRAAGTALVLGLAATVLGLVALGTGRGIAAVLAALAVLFGLALAAVADRDDSALETVIGVSDKGLAALPGLLVVYFGFNGGGFFPGAPAFVAVVLALLLALRLWFAAEPLAGFGPLAISAAGILLLLLAWTALSVNRSDAPGHALLETNRLLLYLLALVLFASVPRTTDRVRLMVRGVAVGAAVVCFVGLTTRVAPDVWPIAPDLQQGRLSYPLTYWNAFGLLAAIGLILCTHLTCSEREPKPVRIVGAAAMPVFGAALFLTFSRGAIAVAILGLVAYVLIARPRGVVGGLVAGAPATTIAIASAYRADLLASDDPTTAAATAQGHDVALVIALCAVGAAVIRTLLLPLDRALARVHLPASTRRWLPPLAWATSVVIATALFIGADGPDRVQSNYDRFVKGNAVVMTGDLRSRLGDPGNNRRIDQWEVAMDGYRQDRFGGLGAGTYQELWNRHRPVTFAIRDAHSVYAEFLAELGATGLLLLIAPLALMLYALLRGVWRGRDRYVYAALAAAMLAWLVRAGLDWDWEMPAVTIWLFCAGGAALAVSRRGQRPRRLPLLPRFGLAMTCLALAVIPAAVAVSQYRIEEAEAALSNGDCGKAEREARGAVDLIAFRPEPHQVLTYCAARRGDLERADSEAREAIRLAPGDWRYRYDAALVRAARGLDARADARTAASLNPRDPVAAGAPAALAGAGARARAMKLLGARQ